MTMPPDLIQEKIRAYYADGKSFHRYRSWEHCYSYFRSRPHELLGEERHYAALQLGFYLASWGMYRGSSFLLQHDYMVHLGVVDALIAPRFSPLWTQQFGISDSDEQFLPLVLEAVEAIREAYRPFAPPSETRQASDTLVTKVLLGTLACLPACDRLFIAGFKHSGFQYSYVNKKFVARVLDFCVRHRFELQEEQRRIERVSSRYYPLMKLVDMCFWEIGAELENTAEGDAIEKTKSASASK